MAGGFQAVLVGWWGALPRTRFWVIGGGVRGEATHPTRATLALVLAVLYEAGRTNNRLSSIWNAMPMTAGKVKLDQPFNATSLLPRNLRYYRFAGSLTTPPCTEVVSWLVLKSYDHIDQAQAEKFTRAVGSHNNRPV